MRGLLFFFWLAVIVDGSITRSQLDDAKRACRSACAVNAECLKKCWKDYFENNKHLGGGGGVSPLNAAGAKRTSAGCAVAVAKAWTSALVLLGLVLVYN